MWVKAKARSTAEGHWGDFASTMTSLDKTLKKLVAGSAGHLGGGGEDQPSPAELTRAAWSHRTYHYTSTGPPSPDLVVLGLKGSPAAVPSGERRTARDIPVKAGVTSYYAGAEFTYTMGGVPHQMPIGIFRECYLNLRQRAADGYCVRYVQVGVPVMALHSIVEKMSECLESVKVEVPSLQVVASEGLGWLNANIEEDKDLSAAMVMKMRVLSHNKDYARQFNQRGDTLEDLHNDPNTAIIWEATLGLSVYAMAEVPTEQNLQSGGKRAYRLAASWYLECLIMIILIL